MDATLVHFGGSVKALGDGRIGGHLVTFTDAQSPDLTGDFFTKNTDYDIEDGDSRSLYYAHGLDRTIGVRKLARLTVKTDDIGIWVETQLKMRDAYEQAIYDLAAKGKLGWSSGAPAHLVTRTERETKDGATVHEILTWPIAEGSLTPTPAEPRNDAFALKSLLDILALGDESKATWSSAYVNDLPDGAFGYIESGGKKDDEGKTTPRSLRHFPYKDKDGKADAAHVRNALARIPQSNLPDSAKNSALRKVRAAAKELGIQVADATKKSLPDGWSYRDLMRFLEAEANEDFGSEGSYDAMGVYSPSLMLWGCNLLENPDRFVYQRTDEPGDTFVRPYTIDNNDAVWGDEQEVIETTTYVDAPNDEAVPTMGKQVNVTALKATLRGSMTFDDHADIATSAMEGFVARAKNLADLAAKDVKVGRAVSASRHAKLKRIHQGMVTAHSVLGEHITYMSAMLDETQPPVGKKDAAAAYARFLALEAHALGVAV